LQALSPGIVAAHVDEESRLGTSEASESHQHFATRVLDREDGGMTSSGYRCYTFWLFNIAMENGPFIDGLPIKNGDFPWLC